MSESNEADSTEHGENGWVRGFTETESDTTANRPRQGPRVGFAETDGPRANRNRGGNLKAQVQALAEKVEAQDRVIRRLGSAFALLSNLKDHNALNQVHPHSHQFQHSNQHSNQQGNQQGNQGAQRPPRVNQRNNHNGRGTWRGEV